MTGCPCGSQRDYQTCCEPYITYTKLPTSPEALMRSRYSAYTLRNMRYIKNTMRGKAAIGFDECEAMEWSARTIWVNLIIISTSMKDLKTGFVEFKAFFIHGEHLHCMHEQSEFHQEEGQWFYVDGAQIKNKNTKPSLRISRGTPCPCGSKKKYKNCHGKKGKEARNGSEIKPIS